MKRKAKPVKQKPAEPPRPKDAGILMVDWTAEDTATLGKMMASEYLWPAIASALGRPVRACQAKAYREGFVLAATADGRRKQKVAKVAVGR